MKLFVLIGMIVAGMSSCGAARVADQSARSLAPSHVVTDHQSARLDRAARAN